MSKHANTIRLSDTIDKFSRRVHINVLGDKVTMVYRWKDSKGSRNHTQRMTLTDEQVAKLMASLAKAADKVLDKDDARKLQFASLMCNALD